MAKKVGELHVEIKAKLDNLDKGLDAAEKKTKKTGDAMEKAASAGSRGFADVAAKGLAMLGALEAGIKVTGALSDAFTAMTTTGDQSAAAWERVGDAVTSLPLGIGPVISALETTAGALLGINQQVAELEARGQAAVERGADAARQIREIEQQRQRQAAIEQSERIASATGGDRLRVSRDVAREQAQARFEAARGGGSRVEKAAKATLDAELKAIEAQFQRERADYEKRRREVWAREDAAAQREEQARQKAAARERAREQKRNAKLENVETQAAEKAEKQIAQTGGTSTFGVETALGTFSVGAKIEQQQLDALELIVDNTKQLASSPGVLV